MNTYSFVGQRKRATASSPARTLAKSCVGQIQKRWQPKQSQRTACRKPAQLSSAEQDALLRQQALAFAQQRELEAAIALFEALLNRNPDSAIDHSNRGLVYFQNGQPDEAIADYNKAIELNPRLDSAYNNRANYYAAQGQYLEAILDYDTALDLNPANIRAWINQGITFRELKMYDRALESFDLALCLNRLGGHIYAERGRTYHLRGDWNCALTDYQKALENLPLTETMRDSALRLRLQVEGWSAELLGLAFEEDSWNLQGF